MLHLMVIGYAWMLPRAANGTYAPLFYAAFLHMSPVTVVFTVMSMIGRIITGIFQGWYGWRLLLAFVKYGSLNFLSSSATAFPR